MPPLGLLLLPVPLDFFRLDYLIAAISVITVACRFFGTHQVLKWPIFMVFLALLWVDIIAYAAVRIGIWVLTSPDTKAVEEAQTYDEWHAAAEKADIEEGRVAWRHEERSYEYDWRHVKSTTERLRAAREADDHAALMSMLLLCLKNNAYGELEFSLYTHTRVGTKLILEQYRDEICACLGALGRSPTLPGSPADLARREFALAARASLGGCALVLSGGATFGMFHFGVVRALVDLKMLPPVICGASGVECAST